jgi:hypothetical protein
MVRLTALISCLLCFALSGAAQQQLNIYTTTRGVVCFSFAETPKVTFPTGETLAVEAGDVKVEFPFSEVEKLTFEDGVTAIATLQVSEKGNAPICIYDTAGRLVSKTAPTKGTATADLSTLPAGTYVVSDGKRTYKVLKR